MSTGVRTGNVCSPSTAPTPLSAGGPSRRGSRIDVVILGSRSTPRAPPMSRSTGRLRRRPFLFEGGDNMPAIIHQPDGTTTFEALPGEEEQQAAHRLELHGRFGSP